MDTADIEELIKPVGFYKRKAIYVKQVSVILRDKYNSDIPRTLEHLMGLPGIGPKMSFLTLQCAWDDCQGIGVDTHVHRISQRLGWAKKSADPEVTRKELQSWLPRDKWSEINKMLVGFGQMVCLPKNPKCNECAAKELCISAMF